MRDEPEVPSFRPTDAWYADWPYGVSTSVQVLASVTGPAADRGVDTFLRSLTYVPDAEVPDGVSLYYWGGYTAETTRSVDGSAWRVVLSSAGEDGFDSLESAADDLVGALRATPGEVRLTWHELPATCVTDADPGDR